jgi:ABC-type sugar transport system permease subunit
MVPIEASTPPQAAEPIPALQEKRKKGILILPWLLILPAVLLVLLVTFLPVVQAFTLSFHDTKFLDQGPFIGFDNYFRFFQDPATAQNFANSFVFTFFSLVLCLPLSIGLALLLNRSFPGRAIFRTILILPWVVSQLLTALLWRFIESPPIGPIAYILGNLTDSRVDILGSVDTAMAGVIVANIWRTFPYAMILTLAALQTISPDLYEAAQIDGAKAWASFRFITLPLIKNTLLIVTITLSVNYFNSVELPLVLTGGGPVNSTEVLGLRVYREAFKLYHYGFGSAIAIIMFLINIIFSLFYIRALRTESYN